MSNLLYTRDFYDRIRPGAQRSAAALVPIMADWHSDNVSSEHTPSVVDVGCGEGWWAREWRDRGYARDVLGIDGPWGGTALDDGEFIEADLSAPSLLASLGDVALCLEVAEHLADPDPFLDWLRTLAPVVFFSAAIPGQPGAGHVSCRWQDDWAASFTAAGWSVDASLRHAIWYRDDIEWWYRQNLFVAYDDRSTGAPFRCDPPLACVHPDFWAVR
jgi:SAM-dependent methyltransferase